MDIQEFTVDSVPVVHIIVLKNLNLTPHPFTAQTPWTNNQITGRQYLTLLYSVDFHKRPTKRNRAQHTHTHTYPDLSVHNASLHNIVPYFFKCLFSWDSPQNVVTHKVCHIPGESMSWLIFPQATHLLLFPFTADWLNFHAYRWDSQVAGKLDSFLWLMVVSMS